MATINLHPGDIIIYVPGETETSNSFGPSEDEIPSGTMGMFLSMGFNYEKFVPGCEPINVLINGSVVRLYRDEVKKPQ
ncbi:MAG: hypothetical protein EBU84_14700 [Actinobacteria bacterium]|nr:hypothetical protein [Actinomycetota bacterium]